MKKESTLKKIIKQSLFLSGILGTISIVIIFLYISMDNAIERTFVVIMALFTVVPLIPIFLAFLINMVININRPKEIDSKNNSYNDKKVPMPKSNNNYTPQDNHKLKTVTTEGYTEFNNILKSSVQNKLLNRESILKLKCELRYRLGTHIEVYKNFEFKNDLHELYVLSKSSVLTKADYEYLTQFISDNLILPKEA